MKTRASSRSFWSAVFVCAVACFVLCIPRQTQAATLVASAIPNPYTGQCPQDYKTPGVITLNGSISGGAPNAAVKYTFVVIDSRNKQWSPPPQSATLDGSGSANVSWRFTPSVSGQYKVELNALIGGSWILSPTSSFSATCLIALRNLNALALQPNPNSGGRSNGLSVAVSPNPYSGPCPQNYNTPGVITLTGSITGGKPNATTNYQFVIIDSKNATWGPPQQSVTLNSNGAATVSWRITPPNSGQYKAEINVLLGGSWILSPTTSYNATCVTGVPLQLMPR